MAKFRIKGSTDAGAKNTMGAMGNMSKDQLTEAIRNVARKLYEQKGCQPGHDLDNWLEAERLVKSGRV